MDNGMRFWRDQFKIFRAIIQLIAIDMMNILEMLKRSAKFLCQYITAHIDLFSIDTHLMIASAHLRIRFEIAFFRHSNLLKGHGPTVWFTCLG